MPVRLHCRLSLFPALSHYTAIDAHGCIISIPSGPPDHGMRPMPFPPPPARLHSRCATSPRSHSGIRGGAEFARPEHRRLGGPGLPSSYGRAEAPSGSHQMSTHKVLGSPGDWPLFQAGHLQINPARCLALSPTDPGLSCKATLRRRVLFCP